jgi:hypothetical protein
MKSSVRSRMLAFCMTIFCVAADSSWAQVGGSPSPELQQIAWAHAPIIIAETQPWFGASPLTPRIVDHLLRVDLDYDLWSANNKSSVESGQVRDATPVVYYSITQTDSDYFIGYYFYHASDGGFWWSDPVLGINLVTTHGHLSDLEMFWVVVHRSPLSPYGVETVGFTNAHGANIPFFSPTWYQSTGGDPFGPLMLDNDGIQRNTRHVLLHWRDPAAGNILRPVIMIRHTAHGTYPAADMVGGHAPSIFDEQGCDFNKCGISPHDWGDISDYNIATHDGHTLRIRYNPDPRPNCPLAGCSDLPAVPAYYTNGDFNYTLVSFFDSPLWLGRRSTNPRLYKPYYVDMVDINGGASGPRETGLFACFDGNTADGCGAQPPWAWGGGSPGGSCAERWNVNSGAYTGCWYDFGMDWTKDGVHSINWPAIGAGALLVAPVHAVNKYWSGLIKDSTYLVNPYLPNSSWAYVDPEPPTVSGYISGPSQFSAANNTGTFTATATGSYPPFSYQWSSDSGDVGSGNTISITVHGNEYVYIDVTDAHGVHAVNNQFLHYCDNPDENCPADDGSGSGLTESGSGGGGGGGCAPPDCYATSAVPAHRPTPLGVHADPASKRNMNAGLRIFAGVRSINGNTTNLANPGSGMLTCGSIASSCGNPLFDIPPSRRGETSDSGLAVAISSVAKPAQSQKTSAALRTMRRNATKGPKRPALRPASSKAAINGQHAPAAPAKPPQNHTMVKPSKDTTAYRGKPNP